MTKLKLSLRNLAKAARNSYCIISCAFLLFISGCSPSSRPSCSIQEIPATIDDTCRNEHKITVLSRLTGNTVWVYIPVEELFVPSKKETTSVQNFEMEEAQAKMYGGLLKVDYKIKLKPAEEKKSSGSEMSRDTVKKINQVFRVLSRIILSMDRQKKESPNFYVFIISDIKNGLVVKDTTYGMEIKEVYYYQDLKKFNFGLLSSNELQHRTVQESNVSPNIIGDKEGKHVDYHDISFDEFITGQITQRISLKFGRPEVNRSADIDKEVLKIVELTLKTYDYKKVDLVELYNGFNAKRQVLTREAIWQGTAN